MTNEPPFDSEAIDAGRPDDGWRGRNAPRATEPPSVSFTFPAPASRMSMNDRLHWAARAGLTSLWRQTAHHYVNFNRARFPADPVPSNVLVTFEVTDPNRRRDPSNAMPTVKAIVDGITDAGVWPDDDQRWVTVIEPRFVKGTNRVLIEITPRQP